MGTETRVMWLQPRDAWSPRGGRTPAPHHPLELWEEQPSDALISDSGLRAWETVVPAF